jgi:hypothetical protein
MLTYEEAIRFVTPLSEDEVQNLLRAIVTADKAVIANWYRRSQVEKIARRELTEDQWEAFFDCVIKTDIQADQECEKILMEVFENYPSSDE